MPLQQVLQAKPSLSARAEPVLSARKDLLARPSRLPKKCCAAVVVMGGLGGWATRRGHGAALRTRVSRASSVWTEEGDESSAAKMVLGKMGAPPHWLIVHTATTDHSVANAHMNAIRSFSAEVPLRQAEVAQWTRDGKSFHKGTAWHMAVAVPPKTLLLVSSLFGETFQADDDPLFVENLDLDGDPAYLLATMRGYGDDNSLENLEESAMELLGSGYASSVDVDEELDLLQFVTTAAGKSAMAKETSASYGMDRFSWSPIGGSGQYLAAVADGITAAPEND